MPTSSNISTEPATTRVSHKERAAMRLDTRTELVRCGVELCTEKGFQVSGINDLLQRVGAPKGSFYHYFASKHEFGEAVIDAYAEYFARKLSRHLDDDTRRPLARLADFVEEAQAGMARFAFKRGCLVGNLGQELSEPRPSVCARRWKRATYPQSATPKCLPTSFGLDGRGPFCAPSSPNRQRRCSFLQTPSSGRCCASSSNFQLSEKNYV
jgi:hypothetical protein